VSNFDVIDAMRALPQDAPARWLRALVAVATLTPDAAGNRKSKLGKLAWRAGMHPDTLKRARRELVAAGLLEFTPPIGRGHDGAYVLKVPAYPRKSGVTGAPSSEEKRGPYPPKSGVGSPGKAGSVPPGDLGERDARSFGPNKKVSDTGAPDPAQAPDGAGVGRQKLGDPLSLAAGLGNGQQRGGGMPDRYGEPVPRPATVPRCEFVAGSTECRHGAACKNIHHHPECEHGMPGGRNLVRGKRYRCPQCRMEAAGTVKAGMALTGAF
jgi:hypothetical protein